MVCLSIHWVEDTLVSDGTFALPGKKKLKWKSEAIQYIVVSPCMALLLKAR
jgi:hypothetical protein